jgi:uncharacterized protein YndB with AHSA1/START domain
MGRNRSQQSLVATELGVLRRNSESLRLRKGSWLHAEISCGISYLKHLTGVLNMATGTVRFHRVLRTKPERIYRAFTDAAAMAKWLPPYGFTCKVHHMDATVGGTFKMSFENFSTGQCHSFGGQYKTLIPGELIEYTDKFDDPNLPGEMFVTVSLRSVSCGTELAIEQSGIPELIPAEMCYLGWQESLAQLAHLVEPEIPG